MAMSWYLVVSSGSEAGSGYQLMGPSITVGCAADNDIVIDDNMVSRHHARLETQGNTYILTDLGSANGTLVNGRRVSAAVALQAGDSITFGKRSGFVFSAQPFLSGDETFVVQGMVPGHAPMPPSAPIPPQSAVGGGLVCAVCGHPNRPGIRFCEGCGGPLAVAQESICPACGTRNRPGVYFCEDCGETLVGGPKPARRQSPIRSQALSFLTSIVGTVLIAGFSALATRFALPFVMSSILAPAQQPTFTPEEAAKVASLYVAGEYPDFLAAQPTVQPALDGGREVLAVGYTRGGAATPDDPLTTLVVLVDAETGQAEVLTPGASR